MEINKIYTGDSLTVLKTFPDNLVDCIITSPPYWGLRDYESEEQIGNEKTFDLFLSNLITIFTEIKRVLKPTGTCFVNIGDTYGGSGSGTTKFADTSEYIKNSKQVYVLPNGTAKASQFRGTSLNKSLLMIPERFAIGMIDKGWVLRNQIIWHKPNQMPASATDRFTVDFEKIFFFVKSPQYYFEQQLEKSLWADKDARSKINGGVESNGKTASGQYATTKVAYREDGMRNMRTVWSINTEGTTESHFATYPQRLVERMLKAGCPENGIVLDPFFGSGTTGIYAKKSGRNYIGIELNPDYVKIAEKRLYKEIGMFL